MLLTQANTLHVYCWVSLSIFLQTGYVRGQTLAVDQTALSSGNLEATMGSLSFKVLGQSGKVELKHSANKKGLTLLFDAIRELDGQGNVVKDKGVSNVFNTFASQSFTFGKLEDISFPKSTAKSKMLNFMTNLSSVGPKTALSVDIHVITSGGEIWNDVETTVVEEADLKLSINFSDWIFLPDGKSVELDITIEMFGKKDSMLARKKQRVAKKTSQQTGTGSSEAVMYCSEDEGVGFLLSNKVMIDNQWGTMESGYPMMVSQGGKSIFKFRFDRFNGSALYDPTLTIFEVGGASVIPGDGEDAGTVNAASLLSILLLAATALIV